MAEVRIGTPRRGEVNAARAAEIDALAEDVESRYQPGSEQRVSLRWETEALAIVRRAAAMAGVSYQTYVKQVAFRQALTDLRDATVAGLTPTSKGKGAIIQEPRSGHPD